MADFEKGFHRSKEGFTVIEVLFVLLIAGLISIIVFQAIPMLQRNSRNNERKQDVAAILDAVSQFELSNSGNIPGAGSDFLKDAKISIYDKSAVSYNPPDPMPTSGIVVYVYAKSSDSPSIDGAVVSNADTVVVRNYQKCSQSVRGKGTPKGSGYFDVVAQYAVETPGGSSSPECKEL